MNKNILIGGALALIVIAGIAYFVMQNPSVTATDQPSEIVIDDTNVSPTGETTIVIAASGGKPVPTTNATVAPYDTTAVVTGTVNPNGAITTYWYEYGTTANLGSKTTAQVVGSGNVAIATPGYITGLAKSTTYYFKLVAKNDFGTVSGMQNTVTTKEFGTAPAGSIPTVTTAAASGITATAASLKGSVNPNKASTKYWFEIGTAGTFGGTTSFVEVGSGSSVVAASAIVAGLQAGTTYYYRLNAQNQFGTTNGAILTFKTAGKVAPAATAAPVVTTQVVASIAASTALVAGTVNPYGTQTSYWFEYSTSASFENSTSKATPKKSAGAVSTTVSVQATLTGLKSNTTYYVRVAAENSGGTVRGDVQTFKTK